MRDLGSLARAIAGVIGVGVGPFTVACGDANVFVCSSDQQCGSDGQCETTGFCSFPDDTCTSGRRYGEHSGGLAGECVGPDAGTETAGTGSMTTSNSSLPITESSDSAGPQISASDDGTGEPATSTASSSTGEATTTGAPMERVAAGIVVLYTFEEGMGTVVGDVSGVEPPIDLTMMGEGYEWVQDGLMKNNVDGIILAEGSATKILEACQLTSAITLEAWVTPANPFPSPPPARVMGYSLDTQNRNFTLGQTDGVKPEGEAPGWVVRMRTSETTVNGYPELLWLTDVALEPTHLVYARDAMGNEVLYVNTIAQVSSSRPGTFANWDPNTMTYRFSLGNELTLDRSWNGTFHLAAIYDRALDAGEVQQNYDAGY